MSSPSGWLDLVEPNTQISFLSRLPNGFALCGVASKTRRVGFLMELHEFAVGFYVEPIGAAARLLSANRAFADMSVDEIKNSSEFFKAVVQGGYACCFLLVFVRSTSSGQVSSIFKEELATRGVDSATIAPLLTILSRGLEPGQRILLSMDGKLLTKVEADPSSAVKVFHSAELSRGIRGLFFDDKAITLSARATLVERVPAIFSYAKKKAAQLRHRRVNALTEVSRSTVKVDDKNDPVTTQQQTTTTSSSSSSSSSSPSPSTPASIPMPSVSSSSSSSLTSPHTTINLTPNLLVGTSTVTPSSSVVAVPPPPPPAPSLTPNGLPPSTNLTSGLTISSRRGRGHSPSRTRDPSPAPSFVSDVDSTTSIASSMVPDSAYLDPVYHDSSQQRLTHSGPGLSGRALAHHRSTMSHGQDAEPTGYSSSLSLPASVSSASMRDVIDPSNQVEREGHHPGERLEYNEGNNSYPNTNHHHHDHPNINNEDHHQALPSQLSGGRARSSSASAEGSSRHLSRGSYLSSSNREHDNTEYPVSYDKEDTPSVNGLARDGGDESPLLGGWTTSARPSTPNHRRVGNIVPMSAPHRPSSLTTSRSFNGHLGGNHTTLGPGGSEGEGGDEYKQRSYPMHMSPRKVHDRSGHGQGQERYVSSLLRDSSFQSISSRQDITPLSGLASSSTRPPVSTRPSTSLLSRAVSLTIKTGYLHRHAFGVFGDKWRPRFFQLTGAMLVYRLDPTQDVRGCVDLARCVISKESQPRILRPGEQPLPGHPIPTTPIQHTIFTVTNMQNGVVFRLSAEPESARLWIRALELTRRAARNEEREIRGLSPGYAMSTPIHPLQPTSASTSTSPQTLSRQDNLLPSAATTTTTTTTSPSTTTPISPASPSSTTGLPELPSPSDQLGHAHGSPSANTNDSSSSSLSPTNQLATSSSFSPLSTSSSAGSLSSSSSWRALISWLPGQLSRSPSAHPIQLNHTQHRRKDQDRSIARAQQAAANSRRDVLFAIALIITQCLLLFFMLRRDVAPM